MLLNKKNHLEHSRKLIEQLQKIYINIIVFIWAKVYCFFVKNLIYLQIKPMQKIILTFTILLTVNLLCAQDFTGFPTNENGDLFFQGVIEVKGKTKSELKDACKIWAVETYSTKGGTFEEVIQSETEYSILFYTKSFDFKSKGLYLTHYAKFLMKLEFKDGKVRYTMSDFKYQQNHIEFDFTPMAKRKGHWKKIKDDAFLKISAIPKSLEKHLIEGDNDDW